MQESGLEPYMHAVTITLHLVQSHIKTVKRSSSMGTPMLPQAHFRLQSLQPCNLDHPHCLSYTIMSRLAAQLHQLKPFSSRSSLRRILSLRACSSLTAYRSHLANQALTQDLEPFAPSSCMKQVDVWAVHLVGSGNVLDTTACIGSPLWTFDSPTLTINCHVMGAFGQVHAAVTKLCMAPCLP